MCLDISMLALYFTELPMRKIRSYVIRAGRTTPSQQKAIDTLWPIYGLLPENKIQQLSDVFGNDNPVVVEIGFGMGDSLLETAIAQKNTNFIGIEVHPPGIGAMLKGIETHQLTNVRLFQSDATEVLEHCIPEASLDQVQIYFSDPWPKKKHHKRRLIQKEFIQLVVSKLRAQGRIHLATDWAPYAEHMLATLESTPSLTNAVKKGGYTTSTGLRPETKFERRAKRLSLESKDILYLKS